MPDTIPADACHARTTPLSLSLFLSLSLSLSLTHTNTHLHQQFMHTFLRHLFSDTAVAISRGKLLQREGGGRGEHTHTHTHTHTRRTCEFVTENGKSLHSRTRGRGREWEMERGGAGCIWGEAAVRDSPAQNDLGKEL